MRGEADQSDVVYSIENTNCCAETGFDEVVWREFQTVHPGSNRDALLRSLFRCLDAIAVAIQRLVPG